MRLFKAIGKVAIVAAGLLVVVCGASKPANALPAFANRLGVPCSTCHEPVFPRLNRTGWEFRQLGYRTRAEMNTLVGQHPPASDAGDGNGKANYGVPISLEVRTAFEDIQQTKYQRFADGFVNAVSVYMAGPANKNFGYWGEAQFPQQSVTSEKTASGQQYYTLVGPSTNGGGATMSPWLRYYKGTPGNFLYARFGNVSVDGFEGNNSSIYAASSPATLTTSINSSIMSGKGLEVGFNHKDDAIAGYVIEPSSDGYRTNKPSGVVQYLHFIGKHSSSIQALYVDGSVPTDTAGDAWNNYSQFLVYGNYREPMKAGGTFNLIGGYSSDHNHDTVKTNGLVLDGSGIGASGYFGELDFERNARFVPYVRYDSFDTGKYVSSGSNKNADNNSYIIGSAIMVDQDARLNLDYNHTNSASLGIKNTLEAQLMFLY